MESRRRQLSRALDDAVFEKFQLRKLGLRKGDLATVAKDPQLVRVPAEAFQKGQRILLVQIIVVINVKQTERDRRRQQRQEIERVRCRDGHVQRMALRWFQNIEEQGPTVRLK